MSSRASRKNKKRRQPAPATLMSLVRRVWASPWARRLRLVVASLGVLVGSVAAGVWLGIRPVLTGIGWVADIRGSRAPEPEPLGPPVPIIVERIRFDDGGIQYEGPLTVKDSVFSGGSIHSGSELTIQGNFMDGTVVDARQVGGERRRVDVRENAITGGSIHVEQQAPVPAK